MHIVIVGLSDVGPMSSACFANFDDPVVMEDDDAAQFGMPRWEAPMPALTSGAPLYKETRTVVQGAPGPGTEWPANGSDETIVLA